ncbi:MAG: hypothetical protein Q4A57_06715 [Porphyromonas circumdentaria]|nr:hypothetical protein [Porphyromonas circumdentaria]
MIRRSPLALFLLLQMRVALMLKAAIYPRWARYLRGSVCHDTWGWGKRTQVVTGGNQSLDIWKPKLAQEES